MSGKKIFATQAALFMTGDIKRLRWLMSTKRGRGKLLPFMEKSNSKLQTF